MYFEFFDFKHLEGMQLSSLYPQESDHLVPGSFLVASGGGEGRRGGGGRKWGAEHQILGQVLLACFIDNSVHCCLSVVQWNSDQKLC